MTIDSPGNANLSQLTLTIQGLADTGKEFLTFNTAGTVITGNYSAPTLTFTGNDTVANWVQVLKSVKYQNTATNVTSGNRTIQITGTANGQAGNTATRTINVGGVNNAAGRPEQRGQHERGHRPTSSRRPTSASPTLATRPRTHSWQSRSRICPSRAR